jgi:gliding motility-associated lipoprotein GldJ
MQQIVSLRNSVILFGALVALAASCKPKAQKSEMTGWNYNDKNMGGYNLAKAKDIKTGPGLVFVEGGSFTMGATTEDIMGDWNNIPRRVTVNSFFIDKTEVANVHYREYIHWIENVFSDPLYEAVVQGAKPDTLVWRSELAYNEPYVEYYFRHPSFNLYPVVGVTWKQAYDFSMWRTDRVNQGELIASGYQNRNVIKTELAGGGQENFNTKSYLMGEYQGIPGRPKKNALKDAQGRVRTQVGFDDGILLPGYRLPTEAEWEYAALGYLHQNPQPRKVRKNVVKKIIVTGQIFAWQNDGYDNLRATRRGSWQGSFLANFKRGSGDNMGVAGGLNDRSAIPCRGNSIFP